MGIVDKVFVSNLTALSCNDADPLGTGDVPFKLQRILIHLRMPTVFDMLLRFASFPAHIFWSRTSDNA